MAEKTAWVKHLVSGGLCTACGVAPPTGCTIGDHAYWLKGLGWLTHEPVGVVRIVACSGGQDVAGENHTQMGGAV